MTCCLTDFHHIRPHHEIDQEETLEWIAKTHAQAALSYEGKNFDDTYTQIKDKLNQLGVGKEAICNRGAHIHDITTLDEQKREIYPVISHPHGKGFTEKSHFFDREVVKVLERFYPNRALLPDHLIHVTCTGYVAPSPAQKLISLRNAGQSTTITHAYHMGCYASLPAIRIGRGFLSRSTLSADIVHTELCSLHMHPLRHSTEQLIVQSLFADGFIKYTLRTKTEKPHLKILALLEEIIPNSSDCMTWCCEDRGLSMTLSKEVPVLITRHLEGYLKRLCSIATIDKEKMQQEALFAVHPGGPKILQYIETILKLQPFQIQHSKEVLKDFGNMSSATLPHIWERILNDPTVAVGTPIISFAFGPGLSISGSAFKKMLA